MALSFENAGFGIARKKKTCYNERRRRKNG
jgi:hypothetical protein